MEQKKLKYQVYLSLYPDCPSAKHKEVETDAYRWVQQDINAENNFKPMHLIGVPPAKMLDDNDAMCIGYGLSMFDTLNNANAKYKSRYLSRRPNKRPDFVALMGDTIATLSLQKEDGKASEPIAGNYGHLTYHEYEQTDLRLRVSNLFAIFDADGNFVL